MIASIRKAASFDNAGKRLQGYELCIELGPFGFQLFVGKRR